MKRKAKSLITNRVDGAPGMTRTCDLLVRSQTLYPTELRARSISIAWPQFPWHIQTHIQSRLYPSTRRHVRLAPLRSYIEVMAYTVKGLEPALTPTLAEIEKKTGPSNFYRAMAHRPDAMQAFSGLYKSLMASSVLDRRIKEVVYLGISCVNECSYCKAHHIKGARAAGLTENEIGEIESENNQHFTAKEQAALHYARELTRTADADEPTRYAVQELFAPDELVELTMVIGLANFTNRFNNGLAIPTES
jgi:uncharacterized peroxidase-related enzyme